MVIGPSFNVKGIEPSGVKTAPLADRQAFWTAVAGFVAEAKMAELRAGLDKDGNPFAPLKPRTMKYRRSAMWWVADPDAPPLQPAYDMSRTRSLFMVETMPGADGLACYWAYDSHTGDSWGKILDYHRQGAGHLPVRDVFGLSPQSLGFVKQRASAWWRGYIAGQGVSIRPGLMPDGSPPRSERGKQGKNVIDLQGGFRVGAPPSPPRFSMASAPKLTPPTLPTASMIRRRAAR
jgi:hypothetical protein